MTLTEVSKWLVKMSKKYFDSEQRKCQSVKIPFLTRTEGVKNRGVKRVYIIYPFDRHPILTPHPGIDRREENAMTIKELSQLYHLRREVEMDRQRLAALEERALPGAQRLSGLPGSGNVQDKLATYAVEIADLRAVIEQKLKRCLAEQQRLEAYIAGIEDSFLRQIFTCRFVEGMSWRQVADKVGGKNTADGVRKLSKRFLLKK